jgi:hypothetical protein
MILCDLRFVFGFENNKKIDISHHKKTERLLPAIAIYLETKTML